MVCVETTLLVDFLRGEESAVSEMGKLVSTNRAVTVAAPTIVELATGANLAESPRERRQLNELLTRLTTLALDQKAALLAGELQAQLIKAGEIIGHVDVTIAAIAMTQGETLITKNVKHFRRIPGLRVEDYGRG